MRLGWVSLLAISGIAAAAEPPYDLLLKGGHVLDAKNGIDAVMDVAVAGGKIARVAQNIPESEARRVARVAGLYVTPGLVDVHVHVYAGTGLKGVYTGDLSVYPDGFSFRTGVTTMVDAGTSGWRNFPDFKQRVIDRAKTRVLAFLNIVGGGMGVTSENDVNDMNADEAARMAKQFPDVIVGFKCAHYSREGFPDIDGAVKAGNECNLPLMVDFGTVRGERNLKNLLETKLRAGDIYTHCYSGLRQELLDGKVNPAMIEGRKRGVLFDVGHGGGSFFWNIAVPMTHSGFWPDTISTDLHVSSMNAGMKDLTNVMSKMLTLGMSFKDVVRAVTWASAQAIRHKELGNLDVGAEADITVLSLPKGHFGFVDSAGARMDGTQFITAELTVRKGVVSWDRMGRAAPDWKTFNYQRRDRAPAAPK
jgi:dihydroorotase